MNQSTLLLYYFLFSTPNTVVIVCYYVSLLCEFLYMCTNPFIYATKFDPVREVLSRMMPCKKTHEQQHDEDVANTASCPAVFRIGRRQTHTSAGRG